MKTILITALMSFTFFPTLKSQTISERTADDLSVSLLTSKELIKSDTLFCTIRMASIIPKDTSYPVNYLLCFHYKATASFIAMADDEVEINFADGTVYSFKRVDSDTGQINKGDTSSFLATISPNFLIKLRTCIVTEVGFRTTTDLYKIDINDLYKLSFLKTAELLYNTGIEEEVKLLQQIEYDPFEAIRFGDRKEINKKYYGIYEGEWSANDHLTKFTLYLNKDTAYFAWNVFSGADGKKKRPIIEFLKVDQGKGPNNLILCGYKKLDPDGFIVLGKFDLKLSENGDVLYGDTKIGVTWYGRIYGIRKKRF